MAFHRLTVPGYAGGLRPGEDYVNNAVAGTPAPADSALGAGTYAGSYFFGANDQVTGAALNRGLKALAQNTDNLDDRIVQMALDYAAADAVIAADLATEVAYRTRERVTLVTVAALPHALTASENLVFVTASAGTLDLPDPSTCVGRKFFLYFDRALIGGTYTLDANPSSTPGGPKFLNFPGTGSEGAAIKAMVGFPYALYNVTNLDTQLEFFTPDGANWLVTAHKGTP